MHNGRSKDGHLLYPAFPYPNYTRLLREDSDALFAYLRSLPPVAQAQREHALSFPFNTQLALGAWRALFFTPKRSVDDASQSAEWNRGAYLVEGLGHCNACHSARNVFGATASGLDLSGGLIPIQNWYAPSLSAPDEAGLAHWSSEDIVSLLSTGHSAQASVMGPMAEVVYRSTQYLTPADAKAMASFLKALPPTPAAPIKLNNRAPSSVLEKGGRVYDQQCKQCHGAEGEGAAGAYPPLAGNRAVTMAVPANAIRIVMHGGFLPATAGNPRPFGMPPFAYLLSNAEVAAVATYVRQSWGNRADPVVEADVVQYR
jgi:mono/diheme cytochrome c family protein